MLKKIKNMDPTTRAFYAAMAVQVGVLGVCVYVIKKTYGN